MSLPPDLARDLKRPGLPVDPLLQLAAGELTAVQTVSSPGGAWAELAPADPMRVALYVWSDGLSGNPQLAVSGVSVGPSFVSTAGTQPVVLHCRDYPGLVQSAIVVWTASPAIVQWCSYTLSDHWG